MLFECVYKAQNYDNQFIINSTYTVVIVVAVAMPIICVAL